MTVKFLFRSMVLNKHLARGFPAQFFTRHMEGSLLLPGITETPTARPACVDTNPVFLSLRQGYSTGDCQSSKEVGSVKKNKTHKQTRTNPQNQNKQTKPLHHNTPKQLTLPSSASLCAPGFPFNPDLCRTLSHILSAASMSNPFARLTAHRCYQHTSGYSAYMEEAHPAIQEPHSWSSQHINTCSRDAKQDSQVSNNFIRSLAIFF